MVTSISRPQATIRQVVDRILSSHRIARQDQEILLSLLSSSTLTENEKLLVGRLHKLLAQGFIDIID